MPKGTLPPPPRSRPRRISRKALAIGAGVTLAAAGVALAPYALAQNDPAALSEGGTEESFTDYLPNPYAEARVAAREQAIEGVLSGKYQVEQRGASSVVDLGGGDSVNRPGHNPRTQFVELSREAEDRIFVVLTEFGDVQPAVAPAPNAQRTEGPLHNEIPEPDRSVDNSTVWQADYSQEHFDDLYFGEDESLKNYYEEQSSGRYSVSGTVTDWTFVPFTQRRYGTNSCGSNVCSTVKALVRDAANQWYADQLAAGRTAADVAAELATFDVWDRYDHDQDGDFNEADGFLDHFQIVHAGGDEADGDPIYGGDAIWSHRWYSNLAFSPTCFPDGSCLTGTQIGNSGFWIGDYTMQPENGGRSVFYHEYGHDLDLPDDYNVINGGDNNNEHWTLMAQSRLGAATDGGIGERGGDIGAWNKLMLGWLDYEVVGYNQHKTIQLGPQEYNSNLPQAAIVILPQKEVVSDVGAPASGAFQWYSGHSEDTIFELSRSVTVPTDNPTLTFKTRYDMEVDWDYAFVAVNGTPIVGTIDGVPTTLTTNEYGATVGWDFAAADWVDGSFDLSDYAGQTVDLSFVYVTDAAVAGNFADLPDGVFLDDIAVGSAFSDGAEGGPNGWETSPPGGWEIVGSQASALFSHYYIAGYRSYVSYDRYLETGPYFFGYNPEFPDKVDHYSYQEGLLISYWDLSYEDNDTFEHPGSGRNLYIDAHPAPMYVAPGVPWRARIQVYDAPFGTRTTDQVTLHFGGNPVTFGGLAGNPVFLDTDTYWYAELPNHGVKLPGYGVRIEVLNDSAGRLKLKVN